MQFGAVGPILSVPLATTALSTVRGASHAIVVVRQLDGTFDREVALTAEDYAALALKDAGAPPGVTQREWESGLARAYGLCAVGFCEASDGDVSLKTAETQVNGVTVQSWARFKPGEWSGSVPAISVSAAVVSTMDQSKSQIAISDVTNGVVTWAPK